MIGAWSINVSGRLYGPFTSERMRRFASEGRLAAHSLVAREGTADWHEANEEPEFADLFAPQTAVKEQMPSIAERLPVATAPLPAWSARGEIGATEKSDHGRAHFAIVLDQKSRPSGNLEEAIASLGPAYRLLPNVWILSTDSTVNAVRNRVVQELGKSDSLFVVDASRGKAAWFNFGPEADVRIRRVWQKAS
jgi:hypothetical protein